LWGSCSTKTIFEESFDVRVTHTRHQNRKKRQKITHGPYILIKNKKLKQLQIGHAGVRAVGDIKTIAMSVRFNRRGKRTM
jgi:hypothetical protein